MLKKIPLYPDTASVDQRTDSILIELSKPTSSQKRTGKSKQLHGSNSPPPAWVAQGNLTTEEYNP